MSDPRSFRDRLQDDLGERHDALLRVVDDALVAKKLVWLSCPSCKKRSEVEVQDTRAAIAAAEFFANQAAGRPGVDERAAAEDDRITYIHVTAFDGVGAEQFDALHGRLKAIVEGAEGLPDGVRGELLVLLNEIAVAADEHRCDD